MYGDRISQNYGKGFGPVPSLKENFEAYKALVSTWDKHIQALARGEKSAAPAPQAGPVVSTEKVMSAAEEQATFKVAEGFEVKAEKTRVHRSGGRQAVTGLVVNGAALLAGAHGVGHHVDLRGDRVRAPDDDAIALGHFARIGSGHAARAGEEGHPANGGELPTPTAGVSRSQTRPSPAQPNSKNPRAG